MSYKVQLDFRNAKVTMTQFNPHGPEHVIALENEQAITLAHAILTKLSSGKARVAAAKESQS